MRHYHSILQKPKSNLELQNQTAIATAITMIFVCFFLVVVGCCYFVIVIFLAVVFVFPSLFFFFFFFLFTITNTITGLIQTHIKQTVDKTVRQETQRHRDSHIQRQKETLGTGETTLSYLVTTIKILWVGDRVVEIRSQQVRLHALWWFICHLDT